MKKTKDLSAEIFEIDSKEVGDFLQNYPADKYIRKIKEKSGGKVEVIIIKL